MILGKRDEVQLGRAVARPAALGPGDTATSTGHTGDHSAAWAPEMPHVPRVRERQRGTWHRSCASAALMV